MRRGGWSRCLTALIRRINCPAWAITLLPSLDPQPSLLYVSGNLFRHIARVTNSVYYSSLIRKYIGHLSYLELSIAPSLFPNS
jgi:hypothetical protein